jgi:hypothetical protein
MNYAIEMGSGTMIYIPDFIMIDLGNQFSSIVCSRNPCLAIQPPDNRYRSWEGIHIQTQQQCNLINLLLFFKN